MDRTSILQKILKEEVMKDLPLGENIHQKVAKHLDEEAKRLGIPTSEYAAAVEPVVMEILKDTTTAYTEVFASLKAQK